MLQTSSHALHVVDADHNLQLRRSAQKLFMHPSCGSAPVIPNQPVALRDYAQGDIKVVASSTAAMTAVLDQAIRERRWIVVTSWMHHWMFALYNLRFLDDPRLIFGGVEWIPALGRTGLSNAAPNVAN